MHDNKWRAEPLGEINCLKRLLYRALPFFRMRCGELVTIRRRAHYFHRQRAKVVQAAEADFARIEHFLNSGHERDADAVAQLDRVEPELALDLAQHFIAPSGAPGIPAGRNRNHYFRLTNAQATGAISDSGTGKTGRSHTCRPAMLRTTKAAIP